MMTLAELTSNPTAMWFMGLSVGLWVAVNAYIIGRGRGYGQGVRYCMKELEPVRIEIAAMGGLHPVSEAMRAAMEAAQAQALPDQEAPDKETRH